MTHPLVRIDDIGAATKVWNQHIRLSFRLLGRRVPIPPQLNIGPLKTMPGLRGWAIYDEMTVANHEAVLSVCERFGQRPLLAITATWVEADGSLTPFPEKFPEQAAWIRKQLHSDRLVIANHGLTHCVVGEHQPRWYGSNQSAWREFHAHLDASVHQKHITESQRILETFFEREVTVLVAPGNVWSLATAKAAGDTNIRAIVANRPPADGPPPSDIEWWNDDATTLVIHDRDIRLYGVDWLEAKLQQHASAAESTAS